MWGQPQYLTKLYASFLWDYYRNGNWWHGTFPKNNDADIQIPADHFYLEGIHDRITEIFSKNPGNENLTSESCAAFNSLLVRMAREIERTGNYSIVSGLWSLLTDLQLSLPEDRLPFLVEVESLILCLERLLGNERKVLVGTRGGKPAWKILREPLTGVVKPGGSVDPLFCSLKFFGKYVDPLDTEFLPEPKDWLMWEDDSDSYRWPVVDPQSIKALLEDAYYNQRYLVNPQGAQVELKHFPPYKSLVLKVKSPGFHDPNYLDFLVVAEVDRSLINQQPIGPTLPDKDVFVVDGSFMMRGQRYSGKGDIINRVTYQTWMAAFIYHDLVTAKEVKVSRSYQRHAGVDAGSKTVGDEGQLPGTEEVDLQTRGWIYIPRTVNNKTYEPRITAEPRALAPHHVTGHVRRANLTERHRTELEEFERKTHLNVLGLLARNPGYTFVRPYVIPSLKGVVALPKFIHARLQSEIDTMFSPESLKKSEINLSAKLRSDSGTADLPLS